jgi:DNA-binding transcriptional MerR regulator
MSTSIPLLLTASDAARILGVTPAAVRLMHTTGKLKLAARTASGMRLFENEEVERLAAERREGAGTAAAI